MQDLICQHQINQTNKNFKQRKISKEKEKDIKSL